MSRAEPNPRAVAGVADLLADMTPERAAEAMAMIIAAIRRDLPTRERWTRATTDAFAAAFAAAVVLRLRAGPRSEALH